MGEIFENILGGDDINNLFPDNDDFTEKEGNPGEQPEENEENKETTETDDPNDLFGDGEESESVGSEKNKEGKDKEGTTTDEGEETSPNDNFYSSIAKALAVDGVFPNLDEDTVSKANDAESFYQLIESEISARLDEKQQRISKALDNGVEPSDIKKYENTLSYISTITDAAIAEESEKGEQLRRNLIYQDFLNKGYSSEKAQKLTERTIDAGTDVEDAKEALQSNKEFFQKAYDKLLQDAQDKAEAERAENQKQTEKMKKSIMEDKQLMGDLEISSDLRKKVYDNIVKPIYKNPETGEYLTALQKYQMENKTDFLKYAGLVFTLTNGFKDFDSFTKGKVKKEMRKGLKELEQTLNSTRRNTDGSLKMVTGTKEDPESIFDGNIKLALH